MIVFNEIQVAEKMLFEEHKQIDKKDLIFLAKYFKYKNMDIKKNLKGYIQKYTRNYNEVIYDKWIEHAYNHSLKYSIRQNNTIGISKNELDCILSVNDFKAQRVLFVMLVVAKYYNNNKNDKNKELYFNSSLKDIFALAKVTYSKKENIRITSLLEELEMVEWYYNGGAKILIYEDLKEYDINIKAHESIVNYLYQFHNKRVYCCLNCHKWIVYGMKDKKKRKRKYCNECSIVVNRININKKYKSA